MMIHMITGEDREPPYSCLPFPTIHTHSDIYLQFRIKMTTFSVQEKLGAVMCCAPNVHLK